MAQPIVEFVLDDPEATPPVYATKGSAAMDLAALYSGVVSPHEMAKIDTGLRFAIPVGYAGIIETRSGFTLRSNTDIPTKTVDSDYRMYTSFLVFIYYTGGRVHIILRNNADLPLYYKKGDKIAQMLIIPTPQALLVQKTQLNDTERGWGGFGSTDTPKK